MITQVLAAVYRRIQNAIQSPTLTIQYPNVKIQPPAGSRIRIRNSLTECTGCLDCSKICPAQCIKIESEEYLSKDRAPKTSKGVVFERKVTSFEIDYAKCVFCGLCVDGCETSALSYDKTLVAPKTKVSLLQVDLVHRPRAQRNEESQ
ncbi:MAG: 4Fe-4S binding protein [Oligoflexia bacterium]|nr:4Fe-4S binding protein [Oligoflexia bacterium]